MRRKAGIAVAAAAAVTLSGAAGVTAWQYADAGSQRPIGTWEQGADIERTPVAEAGRIASAPHTAATPRPGVTKPPGDAPEPKPESSTEELRPGRPLESAPAGGDAGRQKVGELLNVRRLLDYLGGGPKYETFRYPGASYVNLHFGRMAMLPGDYLTVSNPSGTESYRYDAPGVLNTGNVDKWAMSITGDTAVLEMHRGAPSPLSSLLGTLGVGVDQVARGFGHTEQERQPEGQLTAPGRTGREESVCGSDTSTDAVCYRSADPVAYTKSKAIARLLINGTELCTGWRVGKQNRMLTNNHCFTTTGEAYDTEVWFNYQCAQCGGDDVFP